MEDAEGEGGVQSDKSEPIAGKHTCILSSSLDCCRDTV